MTSGRQPDDASPDPPSTAPLPTAAASVATVFRILRIQLLIGVALAAVVWPLRGLVAAYSTLAGAMICVLPSLFFAVRMFATGALQQDAPARHLLRGIWVAEVMKLGVTALLFALVFALVRPLAPGFLFTGFIVVQASLVWAALRVDRSGTGKD